MSFVTGYLREDLELSGEFNPPESLSLLIIGSAPDGPIGEPRFYPTEELARRTFGGTTVGRFQPSPQDISATLPNTFNPDDESLLATLPVIYHCPPKYTQAVGFPYLSRLKGSGSFPVTISFDALGYSASIQPASGGLFIESPALLSSQEKALVLNGAGGLPLGGVLLPLVASLKESGNMPVASLRIGSSWLPLSQPSITINIIETLPGLFDASSNPGDIRLSNQVVPPPVVLTCNSQGDGTRNDLYTTCYAQLTTTSLTIDPGLLGLPYLRRTYVFSDYASWAFLIGALNQDCLNGFLPFTVQSILDMRPYTVPPINSTPSIVGAVYTDSGTLAPNLTAASGWLSVAYQEDFAVDDFGFLILSGLTGKALAADPASAIQLIDTITSSGMNNSIKSTGLPSDPIIVVPWSLDIPCATSVYNPSGDVASAQALLAALGEARADNLLILWGYGYVEGLPIYEGKQIPLPIAYTAITGILRETLSPLSGTTPLRPDLLSLSPNALPYFTGPAIEEPPSGIQSQSYPGPADLDALHGAGLNAVTKAIGHYWTIHGPVQMLSGDNLSKRLVVLMLKKAVQDSLDPYLGQPNISQTRNRIQATLDRISTVFMSKSIPITRFVAQLKLTLSTPLEEGQRADRLTVEGSLTLYTEIRKISFQIGVSR